MTFDVLMFRLAKRFGGVPLAGTTQVQLMNSKHTPDESLEDWADRVMLLAEKSF